MYIFVLAVALLNKSKPRTEKEGFLDFVGVHVVLSRKFLNDIVDPKKTSDVHGVFGTSTQSVFTLALSLPVLSTDTTS